MNIKLFLIRIKKLLYVLSNTYLLRIFVKHRVLATFQHSYILNQKHKTIVDIGANRGQFSLAASLNSEAEIFAFEPLTKPADIFRQIFEKNNKVRIFEAAIGDSHQEHEMHVSAKDDSSSLLELSPRQNILFPGTYEIGVEKISVAPLNHFVSPDEIIAPALLKLDVQGYELNALKGCEKFFGKFNQIYCECSFIPLYEGQELASEIISYLNSHNYELIGVFNLKKTSEGACIQADLLFEQTQSFYKNYPSTKR